eukprot:SAG11_NODE_966_length_6356_cov_29.635608_1_plen_168_part_00
MFFMLFYISFVNILCIEFIHFIYLVKIQLVISKFEEVINIVTVFNFLNCFIVFIFPYNSCLVITLITSSCFQFAQNLIFTASFEIEYIVSICFFDIAISFVFKKNIILFTKDFSFCNPYWYSDSFIFRISIYIREGTRPAHLKLCDTHNSTLVRLVPKLWYTCTGSR